MHIIIKNKNKKRGPNHKMVRDESEKFMQSSDNQAAAKELLEKKADAKQWKGKQEFVQHARKRGYAKTEVDRRILKEVVKKKFK